MRQGCAEWAIRRLRRPGAATPSEAAQRVFTGIIECSCTVTSAREGDASRSLEIDLAPLRVAPRSRPGATGAPTTAAGEGPLVALGDSVAVNGCCLTVADLAGDLARFDVVSETLACTNLGALADGGRVNIERSLRYGEPVDGHLVQGHVERTGTIQVVDEGPGEVRMTIACGEDFAGRVLPKGSVTVDGVSLTVAELGR
ncbi:MAG: riboflavin synthase, partial [Planctomycetota bacterium]